jgi:alkylhydroperoxidase family enzyme
VFSHRPEVMARWGRLLAEIRRPTDDRRFELVTFVVARELRHSSCSLAHGQQLVRIIGKDAVLALSEGGNPDCLSDAEIAMLEFARAVARDAGKITYGQVEALIKIHGFTDEEVFDIAAVASARCFFTKILDALGTEPDVAFMAMDPELREKIGVGRPISHSKLEYTSAEAA